MRDVSSYMITYIIIYGTPVEIYGNLYMEIYENQWETLGKSMGSKVEMISNTENLWHLRYLDEVEK